jgi:hypothetical protein
MATSKSKSTPTSIRKQELLIEGMLYRTRILEGKEAVQTSPATSWLNGSTSTRMMGMTNTVLAGAMKHRNWTPVLLGGLSLLSRWVLRKPLLYSGLMAAAVGIVSQLVSNKENDE